MTDEYDPNTEVGPEIAPGIRLVDDRVGIEVRGIYDGVCAWAYPDERAIINRFTGTDLEGSARWQAVEDWIAEHGEQALQGIYPNRKKDA